MIAVLLVRGGPDAFRWCVPADGPGDDRGRDRRHPGPAVRIKEVVPSFDGRRLDDIIDFLNYTFLPMLLIWRADLLPPGQEAWLILPLLASVYGFCQVQAKTDDGYFLGFPSLWNVVAFYLYVLPLGPGPAWRSIVVLARADVRAQQVPLSIAAGRLNRVATLLGHPLDGPARLADLEPARRAAARDTTRRSSGWPWSRLFYPVFYLGVSWIITLSHWSSAEARRAMSRSSRAATASLGPGLALAFLDIDQPEQEPADGEEADDAEDRPPARSRQEC